MEVTFCFGLKMFNFYLAFEFSLEEENACFRGYTQ